MANFLKSILILVMFALSNVIANTSMAADSVLLDDQGLQITRAELDQALAVLPEAKRSEILARKDSLQNFIGELFSWQKLEQKAEQLDLLKDPALIQRIEVARHYVIRNAVLMHLAEQETETPDFEEAAHDYYLANQEQYAKPRRIKIAQIFMAKDSCNADSVQQKAQTILQQLAAGADFAELAKQHSEGPSAAQGGAFKDWMVEPEQIQNPVVKAAFALSEVGQVSDIIASNGGLHILRLLEDEKAAVEPFEKVKELLIKKLSREYQTKSDAELVQRFYPSPSAAIDQAELENILANALSQ